MRYLIDFIDTTDRAAIDAYMAEAGCEVITEFDSIGKVFHVETAAEPPKTDIVERLIIDNEDTAIKLMDTATFEPVDTETFPNVDDNEHWWKLAVVADIDFDQPTTTYRRVGKDVRVYLLDSGIMAEHPEFEGKDIRLLYTFADDFIDRSGHGTALASVITGKTCAITDAALNIVKIFEPNKTTYMSDIVAALNAVAKDYMTDMSKAAVMNMSWVIEENDYVESKIKALYDLGVVAVAAAGNQGSDVANFCPARIPECVTVGSFGMDLAPSDFSNYTAASDTSFTAQPTNYGDLDLFAPGENIYVAALSGGYGWSAGTSIAAAIETACVLVAISRMGGGDYRFIPQDLIAENIRFWCLNGLLVLSGNYVNSPNLTAWARVRPSDEFPQVNSGRLWEAVKVGEQFSSFAFDATAYDKAELSGNPEGVTLVGNFITGSVPTVTSANGVDGYEMKLLLTINETVHERRFSLMVYDPAVVESTNLADIMIASGLELEGSCGCPGVGATCCSLCPKTGVCSPAADCAPGPGGCP